MAADLHWHMDAVVGVDVDTAAGPEPGYAQLIIGLLALSFACDAVWEYSEEGEYTEADAGQPGWPKAGSGHMLVGPVVSNPVQCLPYTASMHPSADNALQELGVPAFKLWIHLCKAAKRADDDTLVLALSELAKDSGVVSGEGGAGLGVLHAALRVLVSKKYITTAPESGRRSKICMLRTVEVRE